MCWRFKFGNLELDNVGILDLSCFLESIVTNERLSLLELSFVRLASDRAVLLRDGWLRSQNSLINIKKWVNEKYRSRCALCAR